MAALLGEDQVEAHADTDSAPERWLSQIELAKHLGVHAHHRQALAASVPDAGTLTAIPRVRGRGLHENCGLQA